MGKRIIISENEKKEIKQMHSLQEAWFDDLLSFLYKKTKSGAKSVWDYLTKKDDEGEDGEKKEPTKDELEKELKKKDEKELKRIADKEGYKAPKAEGKWVVEGRYCYFVPSGYKGYRAHLLVCGNDTSSTNMGKSSQKYTSNIRGVSDIIFVMTDYKNTVKSAEQWISKKFDAEVTSVAGFSAGGYDVWPLVGDSGYKLVGLIDPSTSNTYSYSKTFGDFGKNTFLVCDPSNWGGYPSIKKNLKEYCDNASKSNGKIYCTDSSHHGMLGIFYEKYSTRL